MEDNKEQCRALTREAEHLRKNLLSVIQDNKTYRKAQERLESEVFAQAQELAESHKETQILKRRQKDLQKRLESERENYENDRLLWQQRESELCGEIKRWVMQNNNHPRRTRSATASNIWASPRPSSALPLPGQPKWEQQSLLERRNTNSNDAKARAQDKLIADLKSQVEQQKRVIEDALMAAETQAQRMESLEEELVSLKQVNGSLMEDNESYQMLLHEKTMTGQFLKKVEEECDAADNAPEPNSLAAELDHASQMNGSGGDQNEEYANKLKKLSDENRMLQESNKALSLYMNKILLKIIDNQELVDVLNIDDLAPPSSPPSKEPEAAKEIKQEATNDKSNRSNCKDSARPRRSTVSSWISTPKQTSTTEFGETTAHSRANTTNGSSSGWSRALKRMTIGSWSSYNQGVPAKSHHDDRRDKDKDRESGSSNSDVFDRDSGIESC
ncbi:hypothetical protein BCR43DRAFT_514839 [Syncephalastrum racemosum]|uniref:Uncharacterized protein n=1 Tax=Syncephalastrum racemosum TaxID=13706 RepID=A0A1X2HCC1_SYNRA|nr:hypothetical protein BCR43DRAFT_514839 [Syncephalastrum racemosum]